MLFTLRKQKTITERVEFCGIGVHSGKPVRMTVSPAPVNSGFVFKRADVNSLIPLSSESVQDPVLCTRLTNSEGVSVSVIEHLMAAFRIAGVTNAFIEIDSEEIPIMDGSALPFYEKMVRNTVEQDAKVKALLIQSEVSVKSDGGYVMIKPAFDWKVEVELDYSRVNHVIKSNNKISLNLRDKSKLYTVVSARTFGWLEDCEKIRKLGMAKGASLENTVIITPEDTILNAGGLRHRKEIVCHKALDLIGDFTLLGYDIIGSVHGLNTSHLQNNLLLRKLEKEITRHRVIANDEDFRYLYFRNESVSQTRSEFAC